MKQSNRLPFVPLPYLKEPEPNLVLRRYLGQGEPNRCGSFVVHVQALEVDTNVFVLVAIGYNLLILPRTIGENFKGQSPNEVADISSGLLPKNALPKYAPVV